MFSLICALTNGCANNRDTGDLIRYCAHYDVTVMGRSLQTYSFPHLSCRRWYTRPCGRTGSDPGVLTAQHGTNFRAEMTRCHHIE